MIEVGADGETAKGIWIMAGLESGLMDPEVAKGVPPWVLSGGDVDGKPVWAHWVWCKYGVDFIKQDGEWRIWHFRCYEVARAPFNRDWISFAKDNQESHDSQLAWFGDDGVPGLPAAGRRADLDDGLLPVRERQGAGARAVPAEALRRDSRTPSEGTSGTESPPVPAYQDERIIDELWAKPGTPDMWSRYNNVGALHDLRVGDRLPPRPARSRSASCSSTTRARR